MNFPQKAAGGRILRGRAAWCTVYVLFQCGNARYKVENDYDMHFWQAHFLWEHKYRPVKHNIKPFFHKKILTSKNQIKEKNLEKEWNIYPHILTWIESYKYLPVQVTRKIMIMKIYYLTTRTYRVMRSGDKKVKCKEMKVEVKCSELVFRLHKNPNLFWSSSRSVVLE